MIYDRTVYKFGEILKIIEHTQTENVLWFIYHALLGVYHGFSLCCVLAFCSENYLGVHILDARKEENREIVRKINFATEPHVLCNRCFKRAKNNMESTSDGSNL